MSIDAYFDGKKVTERWVIGVVPIIVSCIGVVPSLVPHMQLCNFSLMKFI